MTRSISRPDDRIYFTHPLVEESLRHLPAALEYPTTSLFKPYLVEHLHQNSLVSRTRYAKYIAERYAKDGMMNLDLARAVRKFGDSRVGREILYFELVLATPLLRDTAVRWLAELPETGTTREALIGFVRPVLGDRDPGELAGQVVKTFKQLGKLRSPKLAFYIPIHTQPHIEAFCYALARLYPEPQMIRVDLFTGEPMVRAMLWPQSAIPSLLQAAQAAGHVSKVSQLDQYHQFTLAGTGEERMRLLLGSTGEVREASAAYGTVQPAPTRKRKSSPNQLSLFDK